MNTPLKSLAGAMARVAMGLLAAVLFTGTPASAAKVGYYDLEAGEGQPYQVAPITAAGHTPVKLSTLSPQELASVDVLFALNPSNSGYGAAYVGAREAIVAAVHNGLVLVFGDRRVTEAWDMLPNSTSPATKKFNYVRDPAVDGLLPPLGSPSRDINVYDSSTLLTNGPGGTVTGTNLDGGDHSNHGYAEVPSGFRVILVRTSADEAMTFSYIAGAGAVVYTTVPVDYYLKNSGINPPRDDFRNIFTPNLIAYAASLAEQGTLGPVALRYCHSAGHTGLASCEGDQTGKVASQPEPQTTCAPGDPAIGTANVRVTPRDHVTVSWNDLNCDSTHDGSESIRVNPINRDTVGTDVKLRAEAPGQAVVRLRVLPRDGEYDEYCEEEERPLRPQRIVIETLMDGKKLEKWAINGDERISLRVANTVPDDVVTMAVVKFWVGRRATGAKTIVARAFRNGEPVGQAVRRELLAKRRTSFSEDQVYTRADFGGDFDRIDFRAASGSWFGLGSADLQTTRSASP